MKEDENYIIDLCDELLGINSIREHRFNFLIADSRKGRKPVKLPVDAYYQQLNLVIEYHEKQHTEETPFFDKKNKLTVSGVDRGEQRRLYDQRRREILPKHNIELLELSYFDFVHNSQKKLLKDTTKDKNALRSKLSKWVK